MSDAEISKYANMAMRFERLSIAIEAADASGDPKTSDDLIDFVLSSPKESPLRYVEVEAMHSDRYPRLRCWFAQGRKPTWHLWLHIPAEKTPESLKTELAELFAKNGWKVL